MSMPIVLTLLVGGPFVGAALTVMALHNWIKDGLSERRMARRELKLAQSARATARAIKDAVEPRYVVDPRPMYPAYETDTDRPAYPDRDDDYPHGQHFVSEVGIDEKLAAILDASRFHRYTGHEITAALVDRVLREKTGAYPLATGRASVPRADGKPHDPTTGDPIPKPGPAPKTLRRRKPSKVRA